MTEIKLSDFENELTNAELQQALKQLIGLHNELLDVVEGLYLKVEKVEIDSLINRPMIFKKLG